MHKVEYILPIYIKWISLMLFSCFIIAAFTTILKHYDPYLKNDDWFIFFVSLTWFGYLSNKFYIELSNVKFEIRKNHGFRVLDIVLYRGNEYRIAFIDERLQQASIEPMDSNYNLCTTSLINLRKIN